MNRSLIKCHNSPIRQGACLPYNIIDSARITRVGRIMHASCETKYNKADTFSMAQAGLPMLGKFIKKPKTASSVVVQQLSNMSSPKLALPALSTPKASNNRNGPKHLHLTQDFFSDSDQLRRQKLAIRNLEFKSEQAVDYVLSSRKKLSLYLD